MNPATRKSVQAAIGLAAALLAGGFLAVRESASQATRSAPPRATQPRSADLPPVPADLLANYIKAVKASERSKRYECLRLDALQKDLAEWQKDVDKLSEGLACPIKLAADSTSTLGPPSGSVQLPDGSAWSCAEARLPNGVPDGSYILESTAPERPLRYLVRPRQLEELVFTFATGITLTHPAAQPMSEFSAKDVALNDVVAMICRKGGLDSAIRTDMASQVLVAVDLRNASPLECLAVVAKTVGWKLTYMVGGKPLGDNVSLTTYEVSALEVANELASPELEIAERSNVPDWTLKALLKWRVMQAAQEMKKRRLVAVLEPIEPAPPAKGK